MEDECGIPRSDSKVMAGEKRSGEDVGGKSELGHKRVKIRDLESVFRSEGRSRGDELQQTIGPPLGSLDLNANICGVNNLEVEDTTICADDANKHDYIKSRGFGFDLNAEDVSSPINHDPFYPYKNFENLKSRDDSECGSSVGPLEEKDPMSVWKEMKQNGFLSSSHGGVPMPKPRGRKSKNNGLKKKMELAKKEQIDRFAKIAAPSGLLNGLNPGIINHVRNSKQVHSIIEALVRCEKLENRRAESKQAGIKESNDRKKDLEHLNDSGTGKFSLCHEDGDNILSGSKQMNGFPISFNKSVSLSSELTVGDDNSSMVETRVYCKPSFFSDLNRESEDDILALKLSSSTTIASENTSSLSNEDSANLTNVTSLSFKAANVASQWLELLHQDIKGRLAALRRSKKRVRAVIHTELPLLISREFSSNQENDPYIIKTSGTVCSDNATADVHRARWSTLFDQMDKALSEEEKQLESWLNQVKEMQSHCERGLLHCNTAYGLQQPGTSENDCRLEKADNSERDLDVRAAAASIYSTCNFLLTMENLPCF